MIYIAADHGGYKLKEAIKEYLEEKDFSYEDLGTDSEESCDYPDYAKKLTAKVVKNDENKGILICGTGIGMSMTANKQKGIRAALCHNEFTAEMARKHNNANVLCLGGRVTGKEMALKITDIFLNTEFEPDERHLRRLGKVEGTVNSVAEALFL